jgi:hypothetical protein
VSTKTETYPNAVAKACRQHDPAMYQLVRDLNHPSDALKLMGSLIVSAAEAQQWSTIVRAKKPEVHHKPDYFDYWRMSLEEMWPTLLDADKEGVLAARRTRDTFKLLDAIQPKGTLKIPKEVFHTFASYLFHSLSMTNPATKKELWVQFLDLEEKGFPYEASTTSEYAEPLKNVIKIALFNGIAFGNALLFIKGVKESKVFKRYRIGEWVIKYIVDRFVNAGWTSANDLASLMQVGSSFMPIAGNRQIDRGSLDRLTRDCQKAVDGVTGDFIP